MLTSIMRKALHSKIARFFESFFENRDFIA